MTISKTNYPNGLSTSDLDVTGTLAITGSMSNTGATTIGTQLLTGTPQALAAAGAVSLTTVATTVATAAPIALTLANGTIGQVKFITMITDTGDAVLTPTNLHGYTTITFNDVGDSCILLFVGTKWAVMSNFGCTIA